MCKYTKVKQGIITECGFIIKYFSSKWKYCPFCGNPIDIQRERKDKTNNKIISFGKYRGEHHGQLTK